jgi:hypothetical protein
VNRTSSKLARRVTVVATALLALALTGSPADAGTTGGAAVQVATMAAQHAGPAQLTGSGGLRLQPRSGRLPAAAGLDVPPAGVTCLVSVSAPSYFYDGNHHITTSLTVTCNGAISRVTASIWLEGSIDDISFTTEANNLNRSAPGTPFIISAQNNSPVCLQQWHVGVVFVDVVFLAGSPIEAWGWFAGPEVFISC